MEEVDLREEGEVDSEPEAKIYKPIDRPQQNFRPQQKLMDSDSQSSDDDSGSDDGIKMKPKMKNNINKPSVHQRVNPPSKNGNLWRAMLQEECLTENLQTFDVSASRKRKHERGAESYDFELAQNDTNDKRKRFEHSNDSSSSNASNKSQEKRKFKKAKHRNKNKNKHLQTPKILPNILISFNNSDEEYGKHLANGLEEKKSDLIVRVVSVIGKEESLKLYKSTQNIEKKGGMMTMNRDRRRTPGGIFLWLLKTSNNIDEQKKKEIFDGDKEKQMQDGNWTPVKTDPPPPSPAEEISTNTNPDPNLVSQKILNSIPDDDILELDYNEDMDTF